ncbi:ctenidin-3-like [Haliotis rufescens]|uniref:ctenidin-3-like n=1 Tax=Haliotis rufescens TaxID=6454 RepID=UPI001EB0A955|nr:ctenidin-3-like [Haliotis rufescens]
MSRGFDRQDRRRGGGFGGDGLGGQDSYGGRREGGYGGGRDGGGYGGGRDNYGGGRDGGRGGYNDGGSYQSNWNSPNAGQTDVYVHQSIVGRIIGKKGSKIRELQEGSGAFIKVYSDQVEAGKVRIMLSGDSEARQMAAAMIRELEEPQDGNGPQRRRNNACYQCGQDGHYARECTEQQY